MMTNTLLKGLIASVATVFGFGLLAGGVSVASSSANDLAKRDEDAAELVLVADDGDDDGDGDNSGNGGNSGTGNSRDATNSVVSRVSRNGDLSRDDRTRDKTRDGAGAKKRDVSRNVTNDRSRNDTR
jgi:hypothetical protein